jgi:hypothetical protein
MKKRTPWFPGTVKPVHVGVYERKGLPSWDRYSHWGGKRWGCSDISPDAAVRSAKQIGSSCFQDREWRGLAEKPEGGKP